MVDSTSVLFRPGDQVVAIPEQDLGLSDYLVAQVAKDAKIIADTLITADLQGIKSHGVAH